MLLILISYSLETNSITAIDGSDYTKPSETITFKPNETMVKNITITIIDETLVENNENFSVILTSRSSPMLVVEDPNTTFVTILNDDGKMFCQLWMIWIYLQNTCTYGNVMTLLFNKFLMWIYKALYFCVSLVWNIQCYEINTTRVIWISKIYTFLIHVHPKFFCLIAKYFLPIATRFVHCLSKAAF